MDTLSIPFNSIIEGDRSRDFKKYGDLEGLKRSLQAIGSIHPIVLNKLPGNPILPDRDVYLLVAGGRRYRAMRELGITKLFHSSVLDPQRLGFLFKDEVPEHVWREAELDENLHRLQMDWIDDVVQIHRVHKLKKDHDPKWGMAQTGEL